MQPPSEPRSDYDCFPGKSLSPWHSEDKTLSKRIARPPVLPAGGMGGGLVSPSPEGAVVGTGEGLPRPAPGTSLDSFYHKSGKLKFQGDRYHPLQFREFVSERVNASVRVRGIGPDGAAYRAVIPCTYRWSPHMRKRNLAVIYSFVDYVTERGYDSSEVAFLTLTVRHPSRHTYPAAAACVDDLRRGWSLLSRDFRYQGLEYLCVMEPGSLNGFAHYHLPVLGASEAVCEALVTRWCNITGALPVGQDYSFVQDIRNTGAYIAKYLSKTLESDIDYRWFELCYRKRIRTWSMSREARKYISEKYHNPLSGLGVFGDSCMSWALALDDQADQATRAEGPVCSLPDK